MEKLSGDNWPGLPLFLCEHGEPHHVAPFEVPVPLLVLFTSKGPAMEVRQTPPRRWSFTCGAHTFGYFSAGVFDAVSHAGGTRALVVGLPPDWIYGLPDHGDSGQSLTRPKFGFKDALLERLVRSLDAHRAEGEPGGKLYTQYLSAAIVNRFALMVDSIADEPRPLRPSVQRRVQQLIDESLDAAPELHRMAALAGMGLPQFTRAFRKTFNATPHQYVQLRRIERAKQLLDAKSDSLSSIALDLGFSSHAHFTTVFHALTGVTPSAYRRRQVVPVHATLRATAFHGAPHSGTDATPYSPPHATAQAAAQGASGTDMAD
jgi:AraC family transcriptional regulator